MITNYLLCGLAVWMLMGAIHRLYEDATAGWAIDLFEGIIYFPWSIIYHILLYVIIYPIACIWLFIRNAIKGVSMQAWENANITHFWKLGCFRFCYDPDARKWSNKLFLVRIVKPAEKVNHNFAKK